MNKQAIVFKVEGMSCSHCEKRVISSISELEGILAVSVDLKLNSVSVDFEENKVDIEQIKNAIEDAGYTVVC